jgi:MOSC domain-containing protein YiiM
MDGIIEAIKVYPAKGEAGVELAEVQLIEDSGLEGDFHAKGGDRQISLLFAESRDGNALQKEKGFCFSRFKENISIRGFSPDAVRPGLRLETGEAVIEITGEIKHCHEECELYEAGKSCSLAGLNLFARVLKGGVIAIGDGVVSIRKY